MDCELMKQLFTSLVRPHLEYGNVVWHPYLLESVQHRATRMVPGLAKLSYADRLMKLDLPRSCIAEFRNRGDATEVYIYDVDSTDILPRHTACGMTTRGHSLKLRKTECRERSIQANFFGVRVVNLWNSLPEEVVSSDTVNCFKGRFDRYCLGNRFSEVWTMDCSSDNRERLQTHLCEKTSQQATCLLQD